MKITELPAASSLAGTEPVPVVQGGATRRSTVQAVADLVGAGPTPFGINVKDFGAVGDGVTNDAPFIQAAINSLNVNRGGTIFVPHGLYYLATGLTAIRPGTTIIGEGQTGVSDELAKGSTQFIVGNGQWGLTVGVVAGGQYRGYGVQDIHFFELNAGQALGGLRILDSSDGSYTRVSVGRFTAGTGIYNSGSGGSSQSQYNTFTDCRVGKCLIGYRQTGANGTRWIGGYADGSTNGSAVTTGTMGFKIESGDTFYAGGLNVQGYDTLIEVGGNIGHCFYGVRCEVWKTQAIHVLTNARGTRLHGSADNSLIGNLGAGIVIDAGAEDTEDYMEVRNVSIPSLRHVDNGSRTRVPTGFGRSAQAAVPGTIIGKVPHYNAMGVLDGYLPLYDTIVGISLVRALGQKLADVVGATSLVFTVPSGGVTVGNTVIIGGGYGLGSTITVTATDSRSNTYVVDRHDDRNTGGTPHSFVMSAKVTTALQAGDTITISFSSAVNYPIVHAYEYTGFAVSSWADANIGATGVSTSPASGNLTTTADNDLLFGSLYYEVAAAPTLGNNFTQLAYNTSTNKSISTFSKTAPTAAVYTATATLASSRDWAITLVAYKRA